MSLRPCLDIYHLKECHSFHPHICKLIFYSAWPRLQPFLLSWGVSVSMYRHLQKFDSGELRSVAAGMYYWDTWKVVNCLSAAAEKKEQHIR